MCRTLTHLVKDGSRVSTVAELDVLRLRTPIAAGVKTDDPVAVAEGGCLVVPHPQVGDASVNEQHRRTAALDLVVDACSVVREKTVVALIIGAVSSNCVRSRVSDRRSV